MKIKIHRFPIESETHDMKHFPIYTDITHKKIWVIGGGQIAERRISTLLSFGADITLLTPSISDILLSYVKQEKITWIQANLSLMSDPMPSSVASCEALPPTDLSLLMNFHDGKTGTKPFDAILHDTLPYMILFLTDDRAINHAGSQIAKSMGVLVNVCDCQEECDFFFPAIIEHGAIIASVTANGTNHRLVRKVATQIRELLHNISDTD